MVDGLRYQITPPDESFNDFVNRLKGLDDSIHRRNGLRQPNKTTGSWRSSPPTTSNPTGKKNPGTADRKEERNLERERRCTGHLCFFCASPDHQVRECPEKLALDRAARTRSLRAASTDPAPVPAPAPVSAPASVPAPAPVSTTELSGNARALSCLAAPLRAIARIHLLFGSLLPH